MGISLGILFGFIAMLGYGLGNAISQVPSRQIGARKTVFYRNMFISLFLFVVLLFFIKDAIFSAKYIIIALIISLIGYVPLVTFFKALKLGKVGLITPVANSSLIFTVIFSIIFFDEVLSLIQIMAIIIMLLGIIFISIDFKDIRNSHLFNLSSGIPYALITCFLWGVVFFLFKIPVNVLGPILTSFIIEFGIMIFSGVHLFFSKTGYSLPNKKILLYLFFAAFFGAIGTLFFNLGINDYNVSIVAALTFSSPLVATLYGKIVYNEKLYLQQYLAILFIVSGIVLISYF